MKDFKIISISDIHGLLLCSQSLPTGDILTISGDICPVNSSHNHNIQQQWIQSCFIPWCTNLINIKKFKNIVFIAGNHDFVFEKMMTSNDKSHHIDFPDNVHYLLDSSVIIDEIKIYGTPWTVKFGKWAFMCCEEVLHNYFSKIPDDVDILLSHSPIKDYNDTILQYPERTYGRCPNLGSMSLKKHVLRSKPKYVLVGHIHSGLHEKSKIYHSYDSFENYTESINVSILDEDYKQAYKPYEFIIRK